jgi:hypothetical protein
MGLATRYFS